MDGTAKSCAFVTLKYILIAMLAICLINLIVAIPAGLATIDEKPIDTSSKDGKEKSKEVEETAVTTAKAILIIRLALNIVFIVLGIVGVSKESFCLSLTVAILMTFETVASFFTEMSAASILVIVFNLLVTVLSYLYAFMCRSNNIIHHVQVEPVSNMNNNGYY